MSDAENNPLEYLSVHIRRGDRLGMTWTYHNTHLPTSLYVDAALETWRRFNPASEGDPLFYVASDSPAAVEDFLDQLPRNVVVTSLAWSEDEELRAIASPRSYVQEEFNMLGEEERILLTKGMIVDFALLTGLWREEHDPEVQPYATVCGIRYAASLECFGGIDADRQRTAPPSVGYPPSGLVGTERSGALQLE